MEAAIHATRWLTVVNCTGFLDLLRHGLEGQTRPRARHSALALALSAMRMVSPDRVRLGILIQAWHVGKDEAMGAHGR